MTRLLLITGCRRGEIMGLKWEDVEWDRNRLKIARSLLYSPARGVYEDTPKLAIYAVFPCLARQYSF